MSRQRIKIMIMIPIICVTFALFGITYAYYQVKIIENQNTKTIKVTSKILEVTYIDGNAEFSGSIKDTYFQVKESLNFSL